MSQLINKKLLASFKLLELIGLSEDVLEKPLFHFPQKFRKNRLYLFLDKVPLIFLKYL